MGIGAVGVALVLRRQLAFFFWDFVYFTGDRVIFVAWGLTVLAMLSLDMLPLAKNSRISDVGG